MKSSAFVTTLTTAALGVFLSTTGHAAECHFDKTLTLGASPSLAVSTGSGDVKVTPGKDGEVHIYGRVRSSNSWLGGSHEGQVQEVCNRPPIEQNGNDVRIGKDHDEIYRHVSIDYVIETPRGTDVNANTGSGNIELHDLVSHVVANTGSGDIRASNLGPNAKMETGSGNIQAEGVAGDAKLETGSGDIHVMQNAAGDIRANTGSGNIEITGLNGGLVAETGSGNIHAEGTVTTTWKLETGSGNVRLNLPSGKGYEVDAEAASGSITVGQPITMQGSLSKHHVRGNVQGGGPLVHIETGSGDIEIH